MTEQSMTPNTNVQPTDRAPANQRSWMTGAVLIGLGVLLLAGQLIPQNDWLILGGLSALFIAVYVATRKPGFIIPGFILGGLAIGIGLEDYGYSVDGSSVLLGLAGGFLAIYAFNALTNAKAQWWPLVPGTILAMIGGSLAIGGTPLAEAVGRFWPIVLIVIGVAALFGGRRQLTGSKT